MSPLTELRALHGRVVDAYELTPTQAGMLLHALRDGPGLGTDIQQISISLQHTLDPALYVYAWYLVIERHPVLRTRLRWEGLPEPRQEVLEAVELPVTRVDWRGSSPQDIRARLLDLAARERAVGFDLAQAPLMRLFIARVGEAAWTVLWTFHHVLLDGRSFPIVLRETFEAYECLRQRREVQLPAVRPLRGFVEHLAKLDTGEAERWWRTLLEGFRSPTPLGIELSAAAAARKPPGGRFGARQCSLPAVLGAALAARAQAASISVNTLLLAGWALLLHRYGGSRDIVFGTTRSMRHGLPDDGRAAVGPYITTLPMRVTIDPAQAIDEWLATVRMQQLAMRPHEHLSLARIQACSEVAPPQPLFETLVVYDHESLARRIRAAGPAWKDRHFDHVGQTGYALTLVAYGDPQVLLRAEYDRSRFSDGVIERLLGHLQTVLEALAEDRCELVGELPLLTAEEREALIGPPPRVFEPAPPLHHGFEAQVGRAPRAPALTVVHDDGRRIELSYTQLNALANRLARRLRQAGVGPNQLVGLRAERDADVVVGLLAILKAGGAYLPLDPVYPKERAAFMLEDAGVRLMLVSPSLRAEWHAADVALLEIDATTPTDEADERDPEAVNGPHDLAYVIYTSGSTGQPKGVQITHHNVNRLFAATRESLPFDERDVWTLFHSYAFDFSVWEIWGALLHGGRLVVVSQRCSRDIERFRDLLVAERVTVLNQTPTAFRRLIDLACQGEVLPFSLRHVIFGGEALELQMLRPWFERYGDARPQLANMYGITETTVHVTLRPLRLADLDEGTGSVIGEPIADLRIVLLDEQGGLVPVGVPGELAVAGDGLSPGYLKRPQLTAQRFVPDPFAARPGARMYLSGDLARWLDSGDLEYLGRRDQQVKIRGFRIELGEIEARLARHPHVRQSAVVVREDSPGDRRLVAYVVPGLLGRGHARVDHAGLAAQLREHLRSALPDYMVPAHLVFVDELPLTSNGKLDTGALPAPREVLAAAPAAGMAAPATAAQAALAAIWASVLRLDHVGPDQHFFELGGDSILSIQIVGRARQEGFDLNLKDLIECPTVATLAARIDARAAARAGQAVAAAAAGHAPPAVPSPADAAALPGVPAQQLAREDAARDAVALTPIQRWFFDQRFEDAHHWNQAFCFEIPAALGLVPLQTAWSRLLGRHPALCQRFTRSADGAWRVASSSPDEQAPVVSFDLSALDSARAREQIEERGTEAQAGLSLERGPLARAVHFDLGAQRPARLLIVVHHLVVDGVSWRILREDLEALLHEAIEGRAVALPPPTASVAEWARALARQAQAAEWRASVPFWTTMARHPSWSLPQPLPGATLAGPARHVMRLTSEDTRRLLQRVASRFGTPVQAALLSALGRALQARTGLATLRIDLEGHGREPIDAAPDVSRTIGWFTSLFPFVMSLPEARPEGAALSALLALQRQLDALPLRGLGYGVLRWLADDAALRGQLDPAVGSPLLFNYLGQFDSVVAGSSLMRFAAESTGPWRSPRAHRAHPLEVVAQVREGRLEIVWEHDAAIVDGAWVESLMHGMHDALLDLLRVAEEPTALPVEAAAAADALPATPAPASPAVLERPYPLTPMQRLYFAVERLHPELGMQLWQFALEGELNPTRMQRALLRVIERHPVLRSAFAVDEQDQPVQQPRDVDDLPWIDEDWRELAQAEQSRRLQLRLSEDRSRPLSLLEPPLMRVRLIRLADTRWQMIWTTHHLTLDGWSWPIVMAEWSRAYEALESGHAPAESPALPYRAYVEWLTSAAPDGQAFWAEQLAGVAAPTPLSAPNGDAVGTAGPATVPTERITELPPELTARLLALARRWRLTPGTLFIGAWACTLAHAAAAERVVLGLALSGRPPELAGIETLVGSCVVNVPLALTLPGEADLQTWLTQVQLQQFDLARHQYTAPEDIQQASGVPWRQRLFDSLLVFQNYRIDDDATRMGQGVRTRVLAVPEATAYPLTLTITAGPEARIRWLGSSPAMTPQVLEAFASDMLGALQALAAGELADLAAWRAALPPSTRGRAWASTLPIAAAATTASARAAAGAPGAGQAAGRPAVPPPAPTEAVATAQPSAAPDRAAAAAPPSTALPVAETSLEGELAALWAELLGIDPMPPEANFFEAGANSLLLVRAHRIINERLGLQLPLVALLQYPSVRQLARHLAEDGAAATGGLADAALERARRRQHAQRQRLAASQPRPGV